MIQNDLDNLLGLKKEKVLPEIKDDLEAQVNEFADHFKDKNEKICKNFSTETTSYETHCECNKKISKFKKLNMDEFAKVISKAKSKYCGNGPFPISDKKDAKKFTKNTRIIL